MDRLSLAALLDEDREMVLANIARDRSLPAAQAALEKEIDRVMYRYAEQCGDDALSRSAQHILQAMKNTLPVMDSVGEVRQWKQQYESREKQGLKLRPPALICLLMGLALVLAAVLGTLFAGRMAGALTFLKALLPAALGGGALFLSGALAARPRRKKGLEQEAPELRTEYLADGEKAFHCLRGAMLLADGQLDRLAEEDAAQRQREAEAAPGGGASRDALELFAELLESAYAAGGDAGRESASSIRFYLHNQQIDVVDCAPGREAWFEFLPADGEGTIRPALVSNGKLLKKGLAAARRQAVAVGTATR